MSEHPDLPYEQAKNTEYLARLKAKPPAAAGVSLGRSRSWVDPTGIKTPARVFHPLIGRIGFDAPDSFLGRSCYVGPSRLDDGELQVIGWDAPVAQLFYGTGDQGYTVDGQLVVRRTFDHRVDDIEDLDDEWITRSEPSPFASVELQIPAPTSDTRRLDRRFTQVPERHSNAAPDPDSSSGHDGDEAHLPQASVQVRPAAAVPRKQASDDTGLRGLRAAETVIKKLEAPRSDALRSVLATLQPDQFDVVSRSTLHNLIIQGHPGTGKTVVAAYRAAYLVSPERNEGRASSVMLVGPTADYVAHVRGLIGPLDPEGRVVITHIAKVLERTVDLKSEWSGGIGGRHDNIDARAGRFASSAELMLRASGLLSAGPAARRDHVRAIYSLMSSNGVPGKPLSANTDDAAWMSRLPDFDQALRLRRYLPLMAQITLAFQPVPFTDQFPHLLVDEAQDISPIEWNILEQYLQRDGHWTIVGDMNQRRSDATYATWTEISDHLGLGDGDDALPEAVLRRGYRSTTPILQFADKLLPATERGATSIQTAGPKPTIDYVAAPGMLVPKSIETARRLIGSYPDGTVALITVELGPLIQWLGRAGWRRGQSFNLWTNRGETLRVHVPESARGLEFDGVVVVEPGAFPENLGRDGQLYTSLTRANRELAVVWHKDLPDALRRAGRR